MQARRNELIKVREVKRQNEGRLLHRANVVGVGVGFKNAGGATTGELAVVVSVAQKQPLSALSAADRVPREVDGINTDVVETGEIVAFALPDTTERLRPARPGASLGHYAITAGTFGCLVRRGNEIYMLSNNHVLADSNKAKLGDAVYQPGPADGGGPADQIGTLADFVPIAFEGEGTPAPPGEGCSPLAALLQLLQLLGAMGKPAAAIKNAPGDNKVDCALARPATLEVVTPDILNIGVPVGVGAATLGTQLQKTGRTTGYTRGSVQQIDVTAAVNYGGRIAVFKSQLMAGAMSQGGDSGSAVLDMDCRVVGLLFAGSAATTIINPIELVLGALKAEVVTG
jgi:hypothetical protein